MFPNVGFGTGTVLERTQSCIGALCIKLKMGFDGPVCLTRSAPHDAYAGQLLFYNVVDPCAIARSAVLSCIVEAGGEAVLPDSITLVEFKTWLQHGNTGTEDAKKWTFPLLCTVTKVADILDDGRVDEWAELAAASLPPGSDCLARDHSPEEASNGLAKLSDSLRRRVLAAAAVDAMCLHRLLDFLPSHDHAAVLEATITDTKTLEAPLQRSLKVIQALTSIPALPPLVGSLHIDDIDPSDPIEPGSPTAEQATACLIQALQHHSGLTGIHLHLSCITSASLKQLAPAIASLTSLQSLALHTSIGPDSLPTLQHIFHALPHLQHLAISLSSSGIRKRLCDDEAAAAPVQCLLPMLSASTALTSLDLSTVGDIASRIEATGALTMPQLRQLTLRFGNSHTLSCTSIVSHLRAPLTSLHMLHDEGLALPADAVGTAQTLFSRVAAFTALQSLALATPGDDNSAEVIRLLRIQFPTMPAAQAMSTDPTFLHDIMRRGRTLGVLLPECRTRVILDAVSSAVPTTLRALPRLAALAISTDVSVMHAAAPVLAAALTQLTALTVTLFRWGAEGGSWRATLEHLAQLALQRLRMELEYARVDFPGLAGMPPMAHLTALYLSAGTCVASTDDCEALGRMTQLRTLHLVGVQLPLAVRRDCARCLGALPALTSLLFHSCTPDGCISDVLEEQVPEGALPGLQELSLNVWGRFNRDDDAVREEDEEQDEEVDDGEDGEDDEDDDEEEEEEEEEAGDGEPSAVHTMTRAGQFANRLPALVHLDLLLQDDGSDGPRDDLSELIQDLTRESKRGLEVSQTGELPF